MASPRTSRGASRTGAGVEAPHQERTTSIASLLTDGGQGGRGGGPPKERTTFIASLLTDGGQGSGGGPPLGTGDLHRLFAHGRRVGVGGRPPIRNGRP